jgi:hypothetical protein
VLRADAAPIISKVKSKFLINAYTDAHEDTSVLTINKVLQSCPNRASQLMPLEWDKSEWPSMHVLRLQGRHVAFASDPLFHILCNNDARPPKSA